MLKHLGYYTFQLIDDCLMDCFTLSLWNFPLGATDKYLDTKNVMPKYRSSRPEVFCRRGILRNFAKFTGKNLCQSLFFNKVADLRPATLLKKKLWHRCFPADFAKFLRTPICTEHLQWLLLKFISHHTKNIRKLSLITP